LFGLPRIGTHRVQWWDLRPASRELVSLAAVLRAHAINTGAAKHDAKQALERIPLLPQHLQWAAGRLLRYAVRYGPSRAALVAGLTEAIWERRDLRRLIVSPFNGQMRLV
jgi:hypothetical protein